jgi:hypothetical protein
MLDPRYMLNPKYVLNNQYMMMMKDYDGERLKGQIGKECAGLGFQRALTKQGKALRGY